MSDNLKFRAKNQAIHISEDLKGIKDRDCLIHNVEQVCDYVIDVLQSVIGSQRHFYTDNERETMEFWQETKKNKVKKYSINYETKNKGF